MTCKDEPSIQELVEAARRSTAYAVRVADSGIHAPKLKGQFCLDLTITDIYTRGLDPMETLSGVRKLPRLPAIHVPLMTAGAQRWPVWRNN